VDKVTPLSGDLATEIIAESQRVIDMADQLEELESNRTMTDEDKWFLVRVLLGDVSLAELEAHWGEHLEDGPLPTLARRGEFVPFSETRHLLAGPLNGCPELREGDLIRMEDSAELMKVKEVQEYAVRVQRGNALGQTRRASKTGVFYVVGNASERERDEIHGLL
jgi:hypothetical protein